MPLSSRSRRLWLTYAWADNPDGDVDFVVQSLEAAGVEVSLDRRQLRAGERLWEQIEAHISRPENSVAWAIYATENALRSEPCQEELAIALNRALRSRGNQYPLIGIFPGPVPDEIVPAVLQLRLYVRTADPDWVERVRAAVHGEPPSVSATPVLPYRIRSLQEPSWATSVGCRWGVEIGPRTGRWQPSLAAVKAADKALLRGLVVGPRGLGPMGGMVMPTEQEGNGNYMRVVHAPPVTPDDSLYVYLTELPDWLALGPTSGQWLFSREQLLQSST